MAQDMRPRSGIAPDLSDLLLRMGLRSQLVEPSVETISPAPIPPIAEVPAATPDAPFPGSVETQALETQTLPPISSMSSAGLAPEQQPEIEPSSLPGPEVQPQAALLIDATPAANHLAGLADALFQSSSEASGNVTTAPAAAGAPRANDLPEVSLEAAAEAAARGFSGMPGSQAAGEPSLLEAPRVPQAPPYSQSTDPPSVEMGLEAALSSLTAPEPPYQTPEPGSPSSQPAVETMPAGEATDSAPELSSIRVEQPAGNEQSLTPSEEALVEIDLSAKLTLGGKQGSTLDVRIVALAADAGTVVVPVLDVLPTNVTYRLAFTLPGTPRQLMTESRIQQQRGELDENGNARQVVHLAFTWVTSADRDAVAAFCWNLLEGSAGELVDVAANVKIEALDASRPGAQFLGKSVSAGRSSIRCVVDNFGLEPATPVGITFIAPRFADEITFDDGVVGILSPSGSRKSEVEISFARPHQELLDFIAKYFTGKPSNGFLSRFRR